MADQTFPEAELAAAYDWGRLVSVEHIPGGKNLHHHVVTTAGEYVVRRSYRSKTDEALAQEHALVAHLRAHGFPAPCPVPTRRGGTWTAIAGRLFTVWTYVGGRPFDRSSPSDLAQAARALAAYHRLATGLASPAPTGELALVASLAERVERAEAQARALGSASGPTLSSLPEVLARGRRVARALSRLAPALPRTLIHGGCRRGSMRFAGGELVGVLDFDSARLDARVVDLGIAVHDFAKRYTMPGAPEHRVALDLEVAERFLEAYAAEAQIEPAEIEALPALLVAKRLNRALGRYQRILAGVATPADVAKVDLELARVRWLGDHAAPLQAALGKVAARTAMEV